MDTNLSIIELVQRRPLLYTKCNDFPKRTNLWKEVADILKVDVPYVKSRWHLLRTKFMEEYSSVLKGNRTTFKYLTEMSFLSNHINLEAFEMYSKENYQYKTEPEFNITKKDLEDASDDDTSVEFIELGLDDESHRELAQIPFSVTEEVGQNEYVESIFIDEYSDTSQQQGDEVEMSPKNKQKQQQQVEMFIEVSPLNSGLAKTDKTTPMEATDSPSPEDKKKAILKEVPKANSVEKDETVVINANELEKSSKNETKCSPKKAEDKIEIILEKPTTNLEKPKTSPKSENHRCEDTIFGELVTATLRQMQADKKKKIKREIMNLLFT